MVPGVLSERLCKFLGQNGTLGGPCAFLQPHLLAFGVLFVRASSLVWVGCALVVSTIANAEDRGAALSSPRPRSASLARTLAAPAPGIRAPGVRFRNDAVAEESDSSGPVRFSVSLATHLPLSLGASAGVEIPQGIFAELHLGWMPRAYVDLINGFATDLGLYDPALGDLLGASLSGSMVVRASAGVRPFGESGLELLLGYTRLTSGGSETSNEIIQRATGSSLPALGEGIPVEATTHALHVALGVRWLFDGGWFFRGRLGYVHTISATADVQVPDRPAISSQAAALVVDTLTQYGFSPELQLDAGFRF